MSFTHNIKGQNDTINNIIILTKRGADTVYTVFHKKFHRYPSTTIPKHLNFLAKVNKSPYGHFTQYDAI